MTQYEHALIAMERLLTAVGEEHWANWIREDINQWRATSDVAHHLSAYGGMGSFNDVIISVRNQHRVTIVQEPWVNTLFEWLKAICYHLAQHRHAQVTAETLRKVVGRDVPSLEAFVGGGRSPAWMRGYATSDHDLSGWRCLACGRAEVSSRNIDCFIAEDVLPSMVFRACEELTLNEVVDQTLAIDIQGLAESRRQLVAAAEASGIIVRDREGWMRNCPACGRSDTAVYRWRLVRDAMKFKPSSDNAPMRNERWWHRLTAMSFLKKSLVSLLRIMAGVPIVSLLAGGILLLVFGATLRGRSVGLGAAILGVVLFCSVGYWKRVWFKRIRRRFYAVLVPLSLLLYVVPMLLAPNGGTGDRPVRNCFLHGQGRFPRYSPWNIIPEADQIAVGINLLGLGEVTSAEGTRLRSLVLPIYEEMDQDADFHALGSVIGMGYPELIRLEFRTGHYYLFLPEVTSGGKIPCLIFLHGMGGNTKSCLWLLSRQARCAVIAPTFGMGNWDSPGGAEFVVEVAREAVATLPIDPEQVFLMGYSNGAMGVTRAAIKAPELFKGLIYLSPITEDDLFSTTEFSTRKERRVLFLHGGRDQRIPRSFVEGTAGVLKGSGFDVRLKVYEEEDHYLLFSQPKAVLGDVMEWMSEVSQRNPPQATRKTSAAGRRRASPIYVENSACRLQRHPAPW